MAAARGPARGGSNPARPELQTRQCLHMNIPMASAHFTVTDEMLAEIKYKTANGDKFLPTYPITIIDEKGDIVAKANKTLYIRRKK